MKACKRTVLAIIPARCGSKGIPQKNIVPLSGKPLISWTIEAALNAQCVTRTIVSTDCAEIAAVARASGAEVPFIRPAHLATDFATTVDAVRHARDECPGYEVLLVLQPTSPLRTAEDIDAAYEEMTTSSANSCASVVQVNTPPWLMHTKNDAGFLERIMPTWPGGMRRQDFPPVYTLNGAIYFVETYSFDMSSQLVIPNANGYVMPPERSIDIDTPEDLKSVEEILSIEKKTRSNESL